MPAKKKPAKVAAPANTGELCTECPPRDLHPSTTHMSCPHGSWDFDESEAQQGDDEFLDDLAGGE